MHNLELPNPSTQDVTMTGQAIQVATWLDIQLLDYIVVGHNVYVSMKQKELGFK